MRTIGENIKALREQSGLTQDALAEAADVNRVFIRWFFAGVSCLFQSTILPI